MPLQVYSEIGRLRRVLVHRPGLADRGGGSVGAADRVLERHVAAVPGLSVVRLRFADDGVERRLMLEYAPLEKV